MLEAYPLYWPEGWKRTDKWSVENSKFKNGFARSRDELLDEIERLRGRCHNQGDAILSTDISLRQDGLPYANQREPEDSGVAVYFKYKGNDMCFACDKYRKVWENFVAIRKTIEAIRGIERWGASDMMERAFRGFIAIEDGRNDWRSILNLAPDATLAEAEHSYKRLRSQYHPDKPGGDTNMFIQINTAIEQARINLQH
ncbi:MAG: J domain-containing protein [Planctomycetes bacterium]|nr:J domain-containing protein [Planctomycetota bacterium]